VTLGEEVNVGVLLVGVRLGSADGFSPPPQPESATPQATPQAKAVMTARAGMVGGYRGVPGRCRDCVVQVR